MYFIVFSPFETRLSLRITIIANLSKKHKIFLKNLFIYSVFCVRILTVRIKKFSNSEFP